SAVLPAGADPGGTLIVCPSCKRMCPRSDQFCETCGAGLWDTCPRCSSAIPAGQRFCKNCGADVPKAKQAEQAFQTARARLIDVGSNPDPALRHARSCVLLGEIGAVLRSTPDHPQF